MRFLFGEVGAARTLLGGLLAHRQRQMAVLEPVPASSGLQSHAQTAGLRNDGAARLRALGDPDEEAPGVVRKSMYCPLSNRESAREHCWVLPQGGGGSAPSLFSQCGSLLLLLMLTAALLMTSSDSEGTH